MDITLINKTNIEHFLPLMNFEAQADVEVCYGTGAEDQLLMLGMVDGEYPVGAIVCDLDGDTGIAEIKSIFMKEAYRRKGYATDLVISVCTLLSQMVEPYMLHCGVTEFASEEKDAVGMGVDLRGFFQYLDFQEEKDEAVGCYFCKSKDLVGSSILKQSVNMEFKKIPELTRIEKNDLAEEENPFLLDEMNEGLLDESLSLFFTDGMHIRACVCLKSEEDSTTMTWARVDPDCKVVLIPMLAEAFKILKDTRSAETKIFFPYINEASKGIIEKVLGEKARIAETNYHFTYSLADKTLKEWDEAEE